jgi:hypothetical protein
MSRHTIITMPISTTINERTNNRIESESKEVNGGKDNFVHSASGLALFVIFLTFCDMIFIGGIWGKIFHTTVIDTVVTPPLEFTIFRNTCLILDGLTILFAFIDLLIGEVIFVKTQNKMIMGFFTLLTVSTIGIRVALGAQSGSSQNIPSVLGIVSIISSFSNLIVTSYITVKPQGTLKNISADNLIGNEITRASLYFSLLTFTLGISDIIYTVILVNQFGNNANYIIQYTTYINTCYILDAIICVLAILDTLTTHFETKNLTDLSKKVGIISVLNIVIVTMVTIGVVGIRINTATFGDKASSSVPAALGIVSITSSLVNLMLSGIGLQFMKTVPTN